MQPPQNMSELPSPASDSAVPTAADVATVLKQRFPALFGSGCKPLKLRIQADIQQRAPGDFGKQALTAFLRRYTGSTAYLQAMSRSTQRFDLDGQPSGELSDEHRKAAAEELRRRRALRDERVEQVEAGRRTRAALLHDFERTTLTPANFCALRGIEPGTLEPLLAVAREEAAARASAAPPPLPAQRRPRGGGRPPGR